MCANKYSMEWNKILENKKQTNYFSEQLVDKKIIVEILQELHDCCPSKQNNTPYTISVISDDKKNKFIKKRLFYNTWCFRKGVGDPRNTQVLAPYCILFKSTTTERIGFIEIGIAAAFIAYSAISRGLSIGFCECYHGPDADLILGIGYPSNMKTYFHPLSKRHMKRKPDEEEVLKQNMSNYIKWIP